MRIVGLGATGAPFRGAQHAWHRPGMDPLTQLLAPFVPQAMLVAALVALIRAQAAKVKVVIDGVAVLVLAAAVSPLVCAWMQQRAGGFDWIRLALDAPAVWVLAVGGTAWVQKIGKPSTLPNEKTVGEDFAAMRELAAKTMSLHSEVTVSATPIALPGADDVEPPPVESSVRL